VTSSIEPSLNSAAVVTAIQATNSTTATT